MTEPTAEQVDQERERARDWLRNYIGSFESGRGNDELLLNGLSWFAARVRIEAHAAGRDEGLRDAEDKIIAMHIPSAVAGDHRQWAHVSAWIANIGLAIRALRGRT